MRSIGKSMVFLAVMVCFLFLMALPVSSFAVTIDFEGLPSTDLSWTHNFYGDITPNPASVLTTNFAWEGVDFGLPGVSAGVAVISGKMIPAGLNAVVGLDANGIIPGDNINRFAIGDIHFNFVVPGSSSPAVTDLVSFIIGDAGGDVDTLDVHAFDSTGSQIYYQRFMEIAFFPVTINMPGISRVWVQYIDNTRAGYSLDNLSFNTPLAIPEPATLLLLGSGLAGLVVLKRKK